MNVNITGIYDLSEDLNLLQTNLTILTDDFFDLSQSLPNTYANLTAFTILSDDYNLFKISTNTNFSILNLDIENIETNYVTNTSLSTLSTAIDEQFESTTTYIDDKATEQHEYTDAEIEELRNEGYIQEAVTQILAWATSDEGKRFRKKIWDRIKLKWLTFTGKRPFTELLDDVQNASTDELDEMLKVYQYKDDPISGSTGIAGIRSEPFTGKEICMKGDTYIYNGHLYLTGDINKGTFNSTNGTWTQQKKLNDYFVIKGVKNNNGLSIDSTTELLQYNIDPDYFNINASNQLSPVLEFKGIKTNNFLKIDATTKLLELTFNPFHFGLDGMNRLAFRFKTDGGLVENSGGSGIKLSDNSLSLSTSGLQINMGQGLMSSVNGVAVKLADTSLDVSTLGLQISTTYKTELQQIKTDTETFKTQAQTAKTGADAAKTQAEAAKTTAIAQAEIATTQATAATTQATTATSQATIATTQATAATTQATAATAAATSATAAAASATASSGAAAGAATAAAASAAAAAVSATFFQKGDKGDTGATGPAGPQGPAGNPLSITWASPLSYNQTNTTASIDLSNYYNKTSVDTALAGKEAILTFSAPLARTTNTISINLSSYLTSATASSTYQPTLTFNNPMTKTGNNVSIDLSTYATTTALNAKENTLTFSAPLTRTTNTISIDLSSYLTSATASTTYATTTALNGKENTLTFSAPLTRTTNTIGVDLSAYSTTATNNSTFLKLSGGQMTGNLGFGVAPSSTILINCYNASSTAFQNIQMMNNIGEFFYFGMAGNAAGNGSYLNNFFIQASKGLVFNSMNKTHTGVPDMIITGASVGINTLTPNTTYKLDVNGGANATTLYEGGISLSSKYLSSGNFLPLSGGTMTGALNFKTAIWNLSSDNQQRFYFDNNGTTFIQGQGTIPIAFRNNANADIAVITSTGVINAVLKLQEAGVDISTKYLSLSGGTNDLSGKLAILNGAGLTTPQLGFYGGTGDRLILWKGDASAYPYSLGMNGSTMWYSVPTGAVHNFYVNGASILTIASGGLVCTGPIGGTVINEAGQALSARYLGLGGGTLTGALSVNNNINITGSGTNSLIFDNAFNNRKIRFNSNCGIGADTNDLTFYSSGTFTFRNSTLTTTLFSIDGSGSLSFNGTLYPAGGVSSAGNITSFQTLSGANIIEGGVALSSKYLQSATLNNYILKAGDTMTGNLNINSSTQLAAKILLTGQEFYAPSNSMTSGIAFLLGVNRTGNKQLWIADSTDLTQNGVTSVLRLMSAGIDCIATNGTTAKPINIGNTAGVFLGGNTCLGTGTAKSTTTQLTISGASSSYSNPLVQITQTAGWDGNYALQVKGYANIGGDGSATGLRINGEDTGNTIFQNGNRDMGLTVNNANMYFNTNGANRMYISGSTGHVNINNNSKLIFNNNIDDMRIQLWDGYGFGINGGTLRYNTMGNHTFFINGGEIIRFNSVGMGFGNTNPKSYMHLGNCDVAGASPVLLFGKRLITSNGFRTAFIAYDDAFNFCLGDAGGTNDGISSLSLVKQLTIAWNSPTVALAIGSSGFVSMAYGHTGASDERIKTNITTIENALDKTLLLRGVNYNDIRIEPDKLRMGLIAQEVELIIPEVVHTDEQTTMKSIEYQNIVGLLVEAIKELNNKVTNLENIIKKNNLS